MSTLSWVVFHLAVVVPISSLLGSFPEISVAVVHIGIINRYDLTAADFNNRLLDCGMPQVQED